MSEAATEFLPEADFREPFVFQAMRNWLAMRGPALSAEDFRRSLAVADMIGFDLAIRARWVDEFGFVLPDGNLIDRLRTLGPVVEVGAGAGTLARLLANEGVDIVATDNADPGSLSPAGFTVSRHYPVQQISAVAAVGLYADRTVLMAWPSYQREWPAIAAKMMERGQTLALIGEGRGGCTGSDRLFDILDRDFENLGMQAIPTFPSLHDRLTLYRRR